jgi:hypothetical protein
VITTDKFFDNYTNKRWELPENNYTITQINQKNRFCTYLNTKLAKCKNSIPNNMFFGLLLEIIDFF